MAVSVLVPSSLCREADKRAATVKLGSLARAATVFRADRLVVFPDPAGERRWGGGFVETVLRYAATPPYLRKAAWGERDELEYAGVLPPLRAMARTGSGSTGSGSSRQGLVTEVGPDGRVRVNCGLQHPISLVVPPAMAVDEGERVTVRISSREPVRARIVAEPPPGFAVERAGLDQVLSEPDAGLRVAASRHGTALSVARLGPLAERVADDGLTVAFGAPDRGLPAILGIDAASIAGERHEGSSVDANAAGDDAPAFDRWLDTVPDQGSEVVRTEEAVFATLACLTLGP
jgi:predicted SPOUT superfamily RNA methylase MTH1